MFLSQVQPKSYRIFNPQNQKEKRYSKNFFFYFLLKLRYDVFEQIRFLYLKIMDIQCVIKKNLIKNEDNMHSNMHHIHVECKKNLIRPEGQNGKKSTRFSFAVYDSDNNFPRILPILYLYSQWFVECCKRLFCQQNLEIVTHKIPKSRRKHDSEIVIHKSL